MELEVVSVRIADNKTSPYFKVERQKVAFSAEAIVVKVLAFSIDPVMRVWLAGAKTNFRTVKAGDIFNCFGLGQVVHSNS